MGCGERSAEPFKQWLARVGYELNMLAKATTTEISKEGGTIAGVPVQNPFLRVLSLVHHMNT